MTRTELGYIDTVETPDGAFTMLTDTRGAVLASGWSADPGEIIARLRPERRPQRTIGQKTDAADAVAAYYAGDVDSISAVAVTQWGTELQLRGWALLRRIPPGEPVTYTRFAALLGREGAVRASASICARNAPALFVPCHRVLRSDGTLGGFAWGTEVKQSLLDREAPFSSAH